ncbi:MAG: exodeoxyribonuclease V subunit gamma [Balneolia bacterium]|nr:exodeoxyribonuclease V subunit gamma [Balneolia bacterium]
MLHIITSGDLPSLRRAFEKKLARGGSSNVLQPDTVIVPNRDISRWVQIIRAREQGISANLEFVLPANFIHTLNLQVDGGYESGLPDKYRLGWMIYGELAPDHTENEYPALHNYLSSRQSGSDESGAMIRRYELAVKVADIFDQYQLFRPSWIDAWNEGNQPEGIEKSTTADWQMKLWMNLRKNHEGLTDRPALHRRLLEAIEDKKLRLPNALHYFMTAAQPPMYTEAIIHLARLTDVYIYQVKAVAGSEKAGDVTPNPFVLQCNKEHRDLEDLFEKAVLSSGVETSRETITLKNKDGKQASVTLLGQLQENIRFGQELELPVDASLQVHACHNTTREIEVLQDSIIDFLQKNPNAGPSDVLVIAPQLSDHVTAVDAVFGHPASPELRLPYHISDPSVSPVLRMFGLLSDIMLVRETRFKAASLMRIIDRDPVRRRYELSADDIGLIEHWLRETGVRWGADAQDRGDEGVFSWEFGLNRLLMGIMQPAGLDEPVFDILPYTDAEGASHLRVAGVLADIFGALQEWSSFSGELHTVEEWIVEINKLMDAFFPTDNDDQRALQPIIRSVQRLSECDDFMSGEPKLPVRLIHSSLDEQIKTRSAGSGFRSGGITFSTMVPVRHLPFLFIAVLGLNEDSFPGREQASGFDLMLQYPEEGDRNKRISNRALFLDALLTAGQKLHLSYLGFSFKDGSEIAPSLVISELLSGISNCVPVKKLPETLLVKHRLHGFHGDYLAGSEKGLFTYDVVREGISRRMQYQAQEDDSAARFDLELPAAELESDNDVIELGSLIRMLRHPVREMMETRAGMRLPRQEDEQEERDIFKLEGLSKYVINQKLLDIFAGEDSGEGDQAEMLRRYFRLRGSLPYGPTGDYSFDEIYANTAAFMEEVKVASEGNLMQKPELHECSIKTEEKEYLIRGHAEPAVNGTSLIIHYSADKPKRRAEVWLKHLLVAASSDEEVQTLYVCKKGKGNEPVVFRIKCDEPKRYLREILTYYLRMKTLPPPATAQMLSLFNNWMNTPEDKRTVSDWNKVKAYFIDNGYNSFSTLGAEDPYAGLFYAELPEERKDELMHLANLIWEPLNSHFKEAEVSE